MKRNRDIPQMFAIPEQKMVMIRRKNLQISLSKIESKSGDLIVYVTFVRSRAFTPDVATKVDHWMRGESKYNLAVSYLVITQESLESVIELMLGFEEAFAPRPPAKPDIKIVQHL